jgi:RND family efflux transporter MFP subunit
MRTLSLLGASVTLAASLACHSSKQPEAAGAPAPGPARAVKMATVSRSSGPGSTQVPGTVNARTRAALSARIPASVLELPAREGQAVAAGAVLVRLDDAALRAAASAAEASLSAAESDLRRMQALLQKGAATPRELEDAQTRAAGARAAVSGARDSLAYAVLRAPFAGVLVARKVDVGDVVQPGMPLVELEGQGGFEVRATLESGQVALLRPGSELRAHVDGVEAAVTARVGSISPAGDPSTHRFEMKADLAPAPGLRSGLFVRLDLPGAEGPAETALLVPAKAVFPRGGLSGVFVIEGDRARLRWIAPGAALGDAIEVRAGLSQGEKVALDPAELQDGSPVTEIR